MATGAATSVRFQRQAQRGVYPNATGLELPRAEFTMDETRALVENKRIRSDRQKSKDALGTKANEATLKDHVTPGMHSRFYESLCMALFPTAPTTGPLTTISATVTTAPEGKLIRTAGSFIGEGFRLFDVVEATGFTTTGITNNAKNLLITAIAPLEITVLAIDRTPIAAKAAGDTVTISLRGKRTSVPSTGHVDHWYMFESLQPDLTPVVSRRAFDTQIESAQIGIAKDQSPEVNFGVKGISPQDDGAASFFTAVTPAASTPIATSAAGMLFLAGGRRGNMSGFNFTLTASKDIPDTVLSDVNNSMETSQCMAEGSFTLRWETQEFMNAHRANADLGGVVVIANGTGPRADFVSYIFPRFSVFEPKNPDTLTTLFQSFIFKAYENSNGTAGQLLSAFGVQDSLAP